MRRNILGFFVLLLGALMFVGQSCASSITGVEPGEGDSGEYYYPEPLEAQLSSDGNLMRYGAAPVVYVFDPNPPKEQLRVPPHKELALLSESATATFSITYIAEGGTDKFGQYCYTFPENAKAAFNAAASVWGNLMASSVPITIRACWAELSSSSTLGYSGGGSIHRNFTNAPVANTWYSASLANSLAGSDLDPSNADMHITYNRKFSWYFGTDGNTPSNQVDFMSVVLHEICHGLNFAGSAQYSYGQGGLGSSGSPNIYDTFIRDGSGNALTNTGIYPNPSTTLGSALTSNDLWFHGNAAMTANGGNRVKIYAPSSWAGGSSYSHLDYDTFRYTDNRLMVYAIPNGTSIHDPGPVTKGLLKDLGWGGGTPGPTTLISPSGPITDNTPTFSWNAVKNSSSYLLFVNGPSGNVINKWYTAAEANCPDGTGTCSITTSTTLGIGTHKWWVQTWNASGYGPWSTPLEFSLGRATLISPSGPITTTNPTYTWNAVSGSTYYCLCVTGPSGAVINKWYTAAAASCNETTCSITPSTTLAFGNYKWWIQTYGGSAYGPWSAAMEFSLGAVTLISPKGAITDTTPTYNWSNVNGSTYYRLSVSGPSGTVLDRWYTAAAANCSVSGCSVTPDTTLALGNYKWWIQTYNSAGYGPWSSAAEFSLGVAVLGSPSGSVGTATPTYTWSSVPAATYYRLWVSGPSGNTVINQWIPPANAHCDASQCWVTPDTKLGYGNYKWWIQTYSSAGYGPWSAEMGFQVTVTSNGFASEFTTGLDGWVGRTGSWSTSSGNLTAPGVSDRFVSAYFEPAQFSNFDYRARIWRSGCNTCSNSLLVRGNPSSLGANDLWNSTYLFNISRDGYYAVYKNVSGTVTVLKYWTYSPAINLFNAWNEMQVWMKDSKLSFGVNGEWLFTVTDTSLSSGYAGVGFYSPPSLAGDQLWVDRAALTPLSASSMEWDADRAISEHQLELNQAADEDDSGDSDYRMAPK